MTKIGLYIIKYKYNGESSTCQAITCSKNYADIGYQQPIALATVLVKRTLYIHADLTAGTNIIWTTADGLDLKRNCSWKDHGSDKTFSRVCEPATGDRNHSWSTEKNHWIAIYPTKPPPIMNNLQLMIYKSSARKKKEKALPKANLHDGTGKLALESGHRQCEQA